LSSLDELRSPGRVHVDNIEMVDHDSQRLQLDRGALMFKGHNVLVDLPVDAGNSFDHAMDVRRVGTRRVVILMHMEPNRK
jgi:hypothetical protein